MTADVSELMARWLEERLDAERDDSRMSRMGGMGA